jgi:uncharacterized protein YigA (DUF484 family)
VTEAQEQKRGEATPEALPSEALVAEFLRLNPDFFVEHPELLAGLTPPSRSFAGTRRGAQIVDFQQVMLARMRDDLGQVQERQDALLHASRAHRQSQGRVHEAVLKLLACRTFEHLIETLTTDLIVVLDVDVATLCIESGDVPRIAKNGIHVVPSGFITDVLPKDRKSLFRETPQADRRIYGSAADLIRAEALLRLQVRQAAPPAMLALGSRRATAFRKGQSTELYAFLARIVEHCIRTWVGAPT